jgi:hypothetical protein
MLRQELEKVDDLMLLYGVKEARDHLSTCLRAFPGGLRGHHAPAPQISPFPVLALNGAYSPRGVIDAADPMTESCGREQGTGWRSDGFGF